MSHDPTTDPWGDPAPSDADLAAIEAAPIDDYDPDQYDDDETEVNPFNS